MPRKARMGSATGISHIMVRGVGGQAIFLDNGDRRRCLNILAQIKEERELRLFGYCLMSNHVHLLAGEGNERLSLSMKRVGVSYVQWFNSKHGRSGHLYQDRFLSEAVEDDGYFLTVLRYIHMNPVKAGLCSSPGEYQWSSYRAYVNPAANQQSLADTQFAIRLMGDRGRLLAFLNTPNSDQCLDIYGDSKISDTQLMADLTLMLGDDPAQKLREMSVAERHAVVRRLKTCSGAGVRQIARVTGISRSMVAKI